MKKIVILIGVASLAARSSGQGTFVYDQQSADESTVGGGATSIQANQPIGQSFTPALTSIDFVRFAVGGSPGTTLSVNLRSNSITGTIMGSSDSVFFASSAQGYTNFFFSTPIPLTPGSLYCFELLLQTGGATVRTYNAYNYGGGTAFEQGVALPTIDLWFREGVIPEPSSASLFLFGAVVFALARPLRGRMKGSP